MSVSPSRRFGQILTGFGALTVLIGLLVGAPLALLAFAGNPLPEHVPTFAGSPVLLARRRQLFLRALGSSLSGWATFAALPLSVCRRGPFGAAPRARCAATAAGRDADRSTALSWSPARDRGVPGRWRRRGRVDRAARCRPGVATLPAGRRRAAGAAYGTRSRGGPEPSRTIVSSRLLPGRDRRPLPGRVRAYPRRPG